MDLYINYSLDALSRAEGDQKLADYLMDCTFYEYYYRILTFKRYADIRDKQLKETKK